MSSKENFPTECLEEIFHHLQGNDLLKCALVCPQWNGFIGTTQSCMKKISLSCMNRFNNLKRIKRLLRNSQRRYARLTLQGDYSEELKKILMMTGRTWTHVSSTSFLFFETTDEFFEFLLIFQSSIQALSLDFAKIASNLETVCESRELQFP